MLATVGHRMQLGHAGFAVKSCARSFHSSVPHDCQRGFDGWGLAMVPAKGLMQLARNTSGAILWAMFIKPETGTRLAPAKPRKQKSQQALTC